MNTGYHSRKHSWNISNFSCVSSVNSFLFISFAIFSNF